MADEFHEPTAQETQEVTTLEKEGTKRTPQQIDRLMDLYVNRWGWAARLRRALVPVAKVFKPIIDRRPIWKRRREGKPIKPSR